MDGGGKYLFALVGAAAGLLVVRALVAALEAALVTVGYGRAQELVAEGSPSARATALVELTEHRERTAAALRVIDTLTALGAGAFACAAGLHGLPRTPAAGVAVALVGAVFASLLLSSAGRAAAARQGEPLALALALPARALVHAFEPIGRVAAAVARPFVGVKGVFAMPQPPLEELERAFSEYAKTAGTPSDQATSELIHAVFEFRGKVARDVMVPRTEVVAIDVDTPVPEILRILSEEGHSRLPVYRESLDQVVGTLHARDLVPLMEHPGLIVLRDLIRPPTFVPWSKPVDQLLREMQRYHVHMGVVVDEHGGVMGICTLEDVLEEIVGELGDEFEEEGSGVEANPDGTYTVRADTPVDAFNRAVGGNLPVDGDYETVGGFLNTLAGAIPVSGDRFFHKGWLFTVSEANPRRVLEVRAARVKKGAERDPSARAR